MRNDRPKKFPERITDETAEVYALRFCQQNNLKYEVDAALVTQVILQQQDTQSNS